MHAISQGKRNSLIITFVATLILGVAVSFFGTRYFQVAKVQDHATLIPMNGPVWEKNGDVYKAFVPVPAAPPAWLEVEVKSTTVKFLLWRDCFQGDERTGARESLEWMYGHPAGWRRDCAGKVSYAREVIREMEDEYTRFLPLEARRVLQNIGKFRKM